MNKISCFIVEDDPQALSYATSILKQYNNIDILGQSDSIKIASDQIKLLNPDFIILDVFLTDGNAFDFLKMFNQIDFKIIFTTSYAKYAIDAFKFSALDYVLKPYEEKELISALKKVTESIDKENYHSQLNTLLHNLSDKEASKKIVLKNADAIHIVTVNDILYAKSDNNYTTFLLTNSKEILVSKPLKHFSEKLTDYNFFRVHQSFLINISHISSFNKKNEEVLLKDTYSVPVAQSRKKELMNIIECLF